MSRRLLIVFHARKICIICEGDEKLESHKKSSNRIIIEKYTGIDSYNANKKKRQLLFELEKKLDVI